MLFNQVTKNLSNLSCEIGRLNIYELLQSLLKLLFCTVHTLNEEVGVSKGLWEEGLDKLLVLEGFPNTLSQILKLIFENKLFRRFHFSAYQIFEIQKLVRFINKIFQVRALTLQFQRRLT